MKRFLYPLLTLSLLFGLVYTGTVLASTYLLQGEITPLEQNLGGSVCYPYQGCTGVSTAPSAGQILYGQADGTYSLVALADYASSAGGGSSVWATSTLLYYNNYGYSFVIGGTATTSDVLFEVIGDLKAQDIYGTWAGTDLTESQISDLTHYTDAQVYAILSATTSLPNLDITESQISDLQSYLLSADIDTYSELDTIVADQTLAYSGGAFHDGFSDFVANEHIDWTSASVGTIHATNYVDNDTTYVSSDFTHDDLTGFVANEHIDWTSDQGATNIHSGNYTDTNTTYTAGGTLLDLTGTTFSINEGTLTDTKLCTYESGTGIECNHTDANTTYTGGTNLTLVGTTFNVDDVFIVNNANDTMTGVLTADGLTLGQDENITLGAQTLDHNGTDFVFSDTIEVGANDIKTTNADISGNITNYFGATCGSGAYVYDISDAGTFSCTDATTEINSVINGAGGTNLTCSSQTCNVDDAFIKLGGDVASAGTYDFGSASVILEIPNAAAPVADAAGEMHLDTTDNQLQIADSGNTERVFAVPEFRLFSFALASTSFDLVSGGILDIPKNTKDGRDITQFRCHVDGGTSVVVNISDGTNDTESITCGTTQTSDTDVATNSTFNADELWEAQIGTVTGAVDYLIFEAYGYITVE